MLFLDFSLFLPAWLEPSRAELERVLPKVQLPEVKAGLTMAEPDLKFIHRFIPAAARDMDVTLLLHGTGVNENDLLELGSELFPGAAMLSPRGRVLEGDMPRFFRRFAEGVFDMDDLKLQTHAHDFALASAKATAFQETGLWPRVIPMAQTSPRAFCCCIRSCFPAPFFSAAWSH
jgi:hypothetical protein